MINFGHTVSAPFGKKAKSDEYSCIFTRMFHFLHEIQFVYNFTIAEIYLDIHIVCCVLYCKYYVKMIKSL